MNDAIEIRRMTCARIPVMDGEFELCLYLDEKDQKEHLALVMGQVTGREQVLVRVHSECLTGDVFGSRRCDCGPQLQAALHTIASEGRGILIYLRQEGRGIGLLDKLRAYNLQDEGFDTVDANLMLGHQADEREYEAAAAILSDLDVRSIRLLTNNPDKLHALRTHGVHVAARLPLQTVVTAENASYLRTKALRMNHLLQLENPLEGNGKASMNGADGHGH